MDGEEQGCRAGCQDEPDALSHYSDCPLLYNFTTAWRNAANLPRRAPLFHELVTQIFSRNLQYGIVVMGFIDASVYAHNHHHRNLGKTVLPGMFRGCSLIAEGIWKGDVPIADIEE